MFLSVPPDYTSPPNHLLPKLSVSSVVLATTTGTLLTSRQICSYLSSSSHHDHFTSPIRARVFDELGSGITNDIIYCKLQVLDTVECWLKIRQGLSALSSLHCKQSWSVHLILEHVSTIHQLIGSLPESANLCSVLDSVSVCLRACLFISYHF